MAQTSFHLPLDIIEIILSKSPLKSLLRFKSVSKSWIALISNPLFVKNHHQNSKSQDLFICCDHQGAFTLVKLEDQKIEIVQQLETRPGSYNCHCEGVVLLTDVWSHRHRLWNPSTRTETETWIRFPYGYGSFGLGHDPTTDDFKVVFVVSIDNYYVYSFNNKCSRRWVAKRNDGDHGKLDERKGVCVDGAVYWVLSRQNVKYLIYWNPIDEMFKTLQKPKDAEQSKMIFLADLGGSLCLRCEGQEDETTVKIWIKGIDNKSWKYFMTIENIANVKMDIPGFEPQCLVGNKIVIRNKHDDKLVVYSPLQKAFEQFGEMEHKYRAPGLIPYLDCPYFQDKTRLKGP